MASAIIVTTLLCSCGPSERMLSNCTATQPALCWPCDAGFACDGTDLAQRCAPGTWSARGLSQCAPCSLHCPEPGMVEILPCAPASDRVCAACPPGYGCADDRAAPCPMNTHSDDNGTCVPCPTNTSSLAGSTECAASACGPDEFMTPERGCQACPDGFECSAQGVAEPCGANWYSSGGKCLECDPHAESPERSFSAEACVCVPGYVKTAHTRCAPCQSGTVWRDGACVLCDAGHYCVGRTHQDVCPTDTYSTRGSAQCADCRPFSGCAKPLCTEALHCTCDPGYIDYRGSCLRCAPGTFKEDNSTCAPCPAGFECLGGADMRRCEHGTYAAGNASHCRDCADCREVLVLRCNQTHDSVCTETAAPLAVVTILQDFRAEVDGEVFTMFAMILASTLPKARLMHVCGGGVCLDCFQGVCPVQRMKKQLYGPMYRTGIESRFHAARLHQNLETFTHSDFLAETSRATMRKLTDAPFTMTSRVVHEVICPGDQVWDPRAMVCHRPSDAPLGSPRTWLGLLLGISILGGVALYGGRERIRTRLGWAKVEESAGE